MGLKKEILKDLAKKFGGTEGSIRAMISGIRRTYPALTLNAAAQIFAQKKGKIKPAEVGSAEVGSVRIREEFKLNDTEISSLADILKKKNIDFTRQQLIKYKVQIEREIRIEIARLTSEEEALRLSLFLDPIVSRALDLMKGVELLRVEKSNK